MLAISAIVTVADAASAEDEDVEVTVKNDEDGSCAMLSVVVIVELPEVSEGFDDGDESSLVDVVDELDGTSTEVDDPVSEVVVSDSPVGVGSEVNVSSDEVTSVGLLVSEGAIGA